MTRAEKCHIIETLVEHHQELQKVYDVLDYVVGIQPESPLFDKTWRMFDAYLYNTARLVDDPDEMLAWYVYDNDCGNNGFTINDIPVWSVSELVVMMEESP